MNANAICAWIMLSTVFTAPLLSQPTIIHQPSDTSICVDENALFKIIAVNAQTYQWQENDGFGWYDITAGITYTSGENTPELTISDANTGLNAYQYRCYVLDNSGQSDTSDAASLFVNNTPVILSNPLNQTECRNDIAVFNIEAQNQTHFQWQENNGNGWQNLINNAFYSGVETSELSIYTVTGMNSNDYRCMVYNHGCGIPSAEANLTVKPLPLLFFVTGGGAFCEGDEGVPIQLSGSETGITYELLLNDVSTGIVRTGTGNPLDFGVFTETGTYTIRAINGQTTCENMMYNSAEVYEVPLPIAYEISSIGSFCEGSEGVSICLSGSETNVEYELLLDGAPTGKYINGTGNEICFDHQLQEGTYTITGTKLNAGCSNEMTGSVEVVFQSKPICNAGNDQIIHFGTSTTLSGTVNGNDDNYFFSWHPQNLLENAEIQNPVTRPLTTTTDFVLKVTNKNTGCVSNNDTVTVHIVDGPLSVIAKADPQIICESGKTKLRAIVSGGSGNYTYSWTSNPPGFTSSQQSMNVYPEENTTYTVNVNDGTDDASDDVSIYISEIPQIYNVIGGGIICQNSDGAEIGLSNSEPGVYYELFLNGSNLNAIKAGTGQSIVFGKFNEEGTYYVNAFGASGQCAVSMNGTAEIVINESPLVITGEHQVIPKGTSTQLAATVTGGSGNYHYFWKPENRLQNPYLRDPFTISLNESELFTLNASDAENSCNSNEDTTVVFVSGGELTLNVFAQSDIMCSNRENKLICLPTGGTGYYYYEWTSNPQGFTSGRFDPIIKPEVTTTYYVRVTDGDQIKSDSITIYVNNSPGEFNLTGGGGFCPADFGTVIGLDGSENGVMYELYINDLPTGQMMQGTGSEIQFPKQSQTGIYTIKGYNSSCTTLMNGLTEVYMNWPPTQYQLGGNPVNCEGSADAYIELSGSDLNTEYELYRNSQPTGILKSGTGEEIIFEGISQEGNYTINAGNIITGCSSMMNGNLEIVTLPSPVGYVKDTTVCIGDNIQVSASGGNYYTWQTTPPKYTDTIDVELYSDTSLTVLIANDYGCYDLKELQITVEELPDFTMNKQGNLIIIDPAGYANYRFVYNNDILQEGITNEFNIPASLSKGDTLFTEVTNLFGCTASDFLILDNNLSVNAFTPNGDGYNDVFLKGSEIKIIDRWGKELYHGIEGWDGKYNGKLVTPGTYFYIQYLRDPNGNVISTFKGTVTLIKE